MNHARIASLIVFVCLASASLARAQQSPDRPLERGVHLDLHGGDPPDGFHDQGDREPLGDRSEDRGRRLDVPELGEEVLDEGVIDRGQSHERVS